MQLSCIMLALKIDPNRFALTTALLDVWALPSGRKVRFAAFALRAAERATGVAILETGPRLVSNARAA